MSAATPSSPLLSPRSLDPRQASGYFGCSPGTFKKIVRLGIAPAPLRTPEIDRNIYDCEAIDAAMPARAIRRGAV